MVSSLPRDGAVRLEKASQRAEEGGEEGNCGRGTWLSSRDAGTDPTQVSIPRSSFTTNHTVVVLLIKTKDMTAYNTFP